MSRPAGVPSPPPPLLVSSAQALAARESIRLAGPCFVGACEVGLWHARRRELRGPYLAVLALTEAGEPRFVWVCSTSPGYGLSPCAPALAAGKALSWLECRRLDGVACAEEWCASLPRAIEALPELGPLELPVRDRQKRHYRPRGA